MNKKKDFTIVVGEVSETNQEAVHLIKSIPDSTVRVVAGSKVSGKYREMPYVTTPEGYVVSGIISIKNMVEKSKKIWHKTI